MRKFFSNFVCWCGGADLTILNQCPEERNKFESLGTGVIVTALLSGIAMAFALFSLFTEDFFNKNWILGAFIAFWTFIIFSIDWSLIKTMRKKEKMSLGDQLKYFAGVLFRFMVAGAISFTITKPLEVRLFQSRLETEVVKNKYAVFKEENARMDQGARMDSSAMANANNTLETILKERRTGCQEPKFISLTTEMGQLEKEKESLKAKLRAFQSENLRLYNRSDCIIYDTNGKIVRLTDKCERLHSQNQNRMNAITSKIQSIANEIGIKKQEADGIYSSWATSLNTQQSVASDSRTTAQSQFSENQTARNKQITEQNIGLENYKPNLMTYIEAIHTLEKRDEGRYVFYTRWLLFLVILLIDTAPIVIKLLSKRGPYEQILERIEYEQKVQQEQLRFLANKEKSANEGLISDVEAMQRYLLREAMEHYYKNEVKNMGTRYQDYFYTDQKN